MSVLRFWFCFINPIYVEKLSCHAKECNDNKTIPFFIFIICVVLKITLSP